MGRQAQNIYGTELILIIYLVARNSSHLVSVIFLRQERRPGFPPREDKVGFCFSAFEVHRGRNAIHRFPFLPLYRHPPGRWNGRGAPHDREGTWKAVPGGQAPGVVLNAALIFHPR